ncbi:hypothetical protein MATL_G00054090 [Megalops atlanticus]|uniref:Uncharacterized protein n=1 Tax=Megalops atlanticus TaxID=7932 RepID=A0A9D3QCY4_MEGAT|nr:hypothetical protein MATL_G00054090 [Megalops atlanticus]
MRPLFRGGRFCVTAYTEISLSRHTDASDSVATHLTRHRSREEKYQGVSVDQAVCVSLALLLPHGCSVLKRHIPFPVGRRPRLSAPPPLS